MSGLFGTLNTATTGMSANQVALQTSSHNIANTNTDGYSRQRVQLQTTPPYMIAGVGTMGTGVKTAKITRVVDDFVRNQIRDANSQYQFYDQKSEVLGQLEGILNEPSDNGALKQLSTLTSSWTQLGNNPELGTAKTLVVENASTFGDTVRGIAKSVNQLKSDSVQSIAKNTLDFNEKIKQLQTLNEQVYNMASQGETPNDLLDSRDNLLKDLSELANISTSTDSYGRVAVQLGGQDILTNDSRAVLSTVMASNNGQASIAVGGNTVSGQTTIDGDYQVGTVLISDASADTTAAYNKLDVTAGTIGGLQDSVDEIQKRMDELNDFVGTITKTVNTVYTDGKSSTTGFFDIGDDPQNYALNFKVSDAIVANPQSLVVGQTNLSGDGSKVLAIAKLSTVKFNQPVDDAQLGSYDATTMSFKDIDGGSTYAEDFNNIVTKNGISKQQADNTSAAQLSLLNQLEYKNESVSGVSLNEEMSDVIKFQQGFQANARLLSVVSEMLDTLINRTGA
ncbi:MAG: flagellar hook-associated protein FlgK [Liquorilactobacillus hordei]|uniref:flagellar hook-associated protein FlgK n=1 Tax=Liquorilactobacillus hordei TaxID=468911 RepID=UPI0039E73402